MAGSPVTFTCENPGLTVVAQDLYTLLVLGLAVATVSLTVSKSSLFARPRAMLGDSWLERLASCPYCLSHWVAALATWGFGLDLVHVGRHPAANWVASWFALTMASTLLLSIAYKNLKGEPP